MTETTQKPSDSKGGWVGEGVRVGMVAVMVSVAVNVAVEDGVPVTLGVTVKGSGVEVAVEVESGVNVGRGVSVPGFKRKTSRMMIPINAGMAYRIQTGRGNFTFWNGVTAGGSPVNPNALKRLLKLSAYSPTEKFE